jgi:Kdo2-lipid IVA lauroyltransferase/acyltransferase
MFTVLYSELAIFVIWSMHFLPLSWQAWIAGRMGLVFYLISARRRNVVFTNLRLVFPDMPKAERERMARQHFFAFGRATIERGILWYSSEARIRRLIHLEGEEHLRAAAGCPVLLLVPHFLGMEVGWARLSADREMVGMYANQKNRIFDEALQKARARFHEPVCVSKLDGLRPAVRAIRRGLPFYYLPDMDFGESEAVFVPFFGISTATITAVSRIARMGGARVIPCVNRILPGGQGYSVKLYPAWDNFPTDDLEADTARMNAFIEERVKEMPEQYYWVHRRFKTRPPGEEKIY